MIRTIDTDKMPEMVRPDLIDPDPQVAALEPIAVGKQTACALLSVSSRTLDAMVARGLPVVRLGGKNIYPLAQMRQWLAEQAAPAKNNKGD